MTARSEFVKALEYTFRLLSRQDYSKLRIKQKLQKRDYPITVIDDVIAYLEEHNYINEVRTVKNLVHTRFEHRHWGPYKVQNSLYKMGYESDIVADKLQDFDDERILHYCEAAAADYNKRKPSASREQIYRFLVRRGFPTHIIYQALNSSTH